MKFSEANIQMNHNIKIYDFYLTAAQVLQPRYKVLRRLCSRKNIVLKLWSNFRTQFKWPHEHTT